MFILEVHDLLLAGGDMSDSQPEQMHATSASSVMHTPPSSTSTVGMSNGNTFNIHTIIPPTSNGDGTISKLTNLSMQVPQPSSLIQGNMDC